ncbi:MAG: signal recognition particle protein [Clostridia bacterium]|jgi:signal recognition particle subunit SRP54|nr:signal recognition particle protein [Clostridia bacterium]
MAFESLGEKLQGAFSKLKKKGKLNEQDVKAALREVKIALLEADVNFKVVKTFINNVTERAIGQEVMKSLTPSQTVIKIVQEELTDIIGVQGELTFSSKGTTVYMLVGLQGAGKTTTAGKLASYLRKKNKKPLMVACDIYRPAAIKQLEVIGKGLDIPVFSMGDKQNPVDIAKAGIAKAKEEGNDVVIIDTAGRLHIDEDLMEELVNIKKEIRPNEILLTVDSMIGQDAVNVSKSFNDALGVDGIILTKFDGDTRGGAALSIKHVTGKSIKFVGTGEKLNEFEEFKPDRLVSRMLGMGDVLSLIEKAKEAVDEEEAALMQEKFRKMEFNFNDFLKQMQQVKKMGSMTGLLKMIPGAGKLKDLEIDEKELAHIEAIIKSMTEEERENPAILNPSRKNRIAKGSGRPIQDVNRLVKQFEESKKMMKKFMNMSKKGNFKLPF